MSKAGNSFSKQINKSTKIIISPCLPDIKDNSSIYAINWFNLKRKWLYNFYNRLAAPLVVQVHGRVHFKGFQQKRLIGSENKSREALLIVHYPGPKAFFELISKTYFQLISILRLSAVESFNFGFTERHDESNNNQNFKHKKYLVHHFTMDNRLVSTPYKSLSDVISVSAKIHYIGTKVAYVISENQNGKQTKAPFMMDGIVVLEGDSVSELEKFIHQKEYKDFMSKLENNYVGLFTRVA